MSGRRLPTAAGTWKVRMSEVSHKGSCAAKLKLSPDPKGRTVMFAGKADDLDTAFQCSLSPVLERHHKVWNLFVYDVIFIIVSAALSCLLELHDNPTPHRITGT